MIQAEDKKKAMEDFKEKLHTDINPRCVLNQHYPSQSPTIFQAHNKCKKNYNSLIFKRNKKNYFMFLQIN